MRGSYNNPVPYYDKRDDLDQEALVNLVPSLELFRLYERRQGTTTMSLP